MARIEFEPYEELTKDDLGKIYECIESYGKDVEVTQTERDIYVVSEIDHDWQRVLRMTEEQVKAIKWFIDESEVDYYIEKASEVTEEIE